MAPKPNKLEDTAAQLAARMSRLFFASLELESEKQVQAQLIQLDHDLIAHDYICVRSALWGFFVHYEDGGWLASDLRYLKEHDPATIATQLLPIFDPPSVTPLLFSLIEYADDASTFTKTLRAGALLLRWVALDPNYVLVEPALLCFESRLARQEQIVMDDIVLSIDRVLRLLHEPLPALSALVEPSLGSLAFTAPLVAV